MLLPLRRPRVPPIGSGGLWREHLDAFTKIGSPIPSNSIALHPKITNQVRVNVAGATSTPTKELADGPPPGRSGRGTRP